MTVEVINETDWVIDCQEFVELTEYVLYQMHVSPKAEVCILFVDSIVMEQLHIRWLGLPGPTDVISFPMDELKPGTQVAPSSSGVLGDVCVCPQVAKEQADEASHAVEEEMLLLTTHGLLHLLGYDHQDPEEREVMFELQRKLLLSFLATR